jgi:hypothetical protein
MSIFDGLGIFIWYVNKCAGTFKPETAEARNSIKAVMDTVGMRWAAPKVTDGYLPFNRNGNTYYGTDNILPEFFKAQKAAGRPLIGWQYIYGALPQKEAEIAAEQISKYELQGLILDPEAEYKASGRSVAARTYMRKLRDLCPNVSIALCSYRYPSFHQEIPWAAFLENMDASKGDVHMPQVYWEDDFRSTAPKIQLEKSMNELRKLKDLPFVPAGSAYGKMGSLQYWNPTPEQMSNFSASAKLLGCTGVTWWAWDTIVDKDCTLPTEKGKQGWWKALMSLSSDWTGSGSPAIPQPNVPVTFTDAEKLSRLWGAHPELHQ